VLRRLFTAASVLSVLLCISTAALLVRSHARPMWHFPTTAPAVAAHSELALGDGTLAISTLEVVTPNASVALRLHSAFELFATSRGYFEVSCSCRVAMGT